MSAEHTKTTEQEVPGKGLAPDPEIAAINSLISALSPLRVEARARVVAYVFGRLGLEMEAPQVQLQPHRDLLPSVSLSHLATSKPTVLDIRSFANEKQPMTAIERTAVVAFYLAEMAPDNERRMSIGQDEVTRYFKQAGFPLPSSPSMALVHSKNAGFFEAEGPGQYRLNAVGYNLVAHRMPKETSGGTLSRRSATTSHRSTRKPKKSPSQQKALPAPKSAAKKK